MDLVIGSILLVLLLPAIALCAVAVRLSSPGPVIIRQRRIGRGGQPFDLLKYRSMYEDADEHRCEVAHLNLHGTEAGMFKAKRDPRVTGVGRWIRRWSIDELPQLVNVLRGEMSLVGPRPLIECEDRQVEGEARRRLSVPPGITGLWQVRGRSDLSFEVMLNLDESYVDAWSLRVDVKILVLTVGAVLRGRGAY